MTTVSTAKNAADRRRMRVALARELRQDNPGIRSEGLKAMAGSLLNAVGYDIMRVSTIDPVTRRCLVWNVLGAKAGIAVIINGG